MLVVALGLVLYYFLLFRPLSRRVEALDEPLDVVSRELVNLSLESQGIHDLDLAQVTKTKEALQASLATTAKVGQMIAGRVELEPDIRAKLKEPFLLIDYQNERQKRIEQVSALAKTQQVALDPAVPSGFPEYKAEMKEPNLLWADLSIVHHILTVAINNKVGAVKNLNVLPVQLRRAAGETSLEAISVRVELVAPMESVSGFLLALPLRAEEMKAAGLPESLPGKPALFLDKLILRKQTPEKPAEVNLDLVVCGFVRPVDILVPRPEEKTRLEDVKKTGK